MPFQVETKLVRDHGLVGVLCTPSGVGLAPGVMLLGGSEGGLHELDAQMLAAEGVTVLALAYFGAPGLPSGLIDIPLEYFFRGLDLLEEHPRTGQLGVTGGSRGGEAALLIAAHDARVAAVVSVVGSGLVTQGIDYRAGGLLDILDTPTGSWTLGGEPLPYLPYEVSAEMRSRIADAKPVGLALAFRDVPQDPAVLERVSIPVEAIRGSVLLISADDDHMWPSTAYSEVAAARLRQHRRPIEHKVFHGAGHAIAGPPSPVSSSTTTPGPGVTFEMGGTPAANAQAREEAWALTIEFLRERLA